MLGTTFFKRGEKGGGGGEALYANTNGSVQPYGWKIGIRWRYKISATSGKKASREIMVGQAKTCRDAKAGSGQPSLRGRFGGGTGGNVRGCGVGGGFGGTDIKKGGGGLKRKKIWGKGGKVFEEQEMRSGNNVHEEESNNYRGATSREM